MLYPIKTNKILFSPCIDKLETAYDIFCITTTDKYFKYGAEILDFNTIDTKIESIVFEKGNKLYVLVKKGILSISELKKELAKTAEYESITLTKVDFNTIPDQYLLQLLLNALTNYENKYLKYNNLTGHLYCLHPSWLINSPKSEKQKIVWQIPCLEIKVSNSLNLELNVRTFTSIKLKKMMNLNSEFLDNSPKYILNAKNTLTRVFDHADNYYILRQIKGQRTTIPFMDIKNHRRFCKSKMGVLQDILSRFHERYNGLAEIKFDEICDYKAFEYDKCRAKENKNKILETLNHIQIKIIDTICNEESQSFCTDLQNLIKEKYQLKVSIGKKINNKALNIRVIHNEDYYNGIHDPYKKYVNTAVQHITLEDFKDCAKFAVDAVIHELLIKQDLVNGKISLFNWPDLNFSDVLTFGIPINTENNMDKYIFMDIQPDGTFKFRELTLDLFSNDEYQKYCNILNNYKLQGHKINGLIVFGDNIINLLMETGQITIPEIELLSNELAANNRNLRGKDVRNKLLSASIDIKCFRKNNTGYYFVGTIGNGMNYKISHAANIRSIIGVESSPILLEELMPLMNVLFVKNNQLTAIPFPFKYLNEYIKNYIEFE